MRKLWRGKRQTGLEDRLRALRQEPREPFVDDLVAQVMPPTPTRQRLRLGVALATAVVVAVPFLAFGGVSFAAHSVQATVHSLTSSHDVYSVDGSKSGKGGSGNGGSGNGGDGSSAHHEYCPPKDRRDHCKPPPPPPHCDKGEHFVDGKCKHNPPPPPPHCDRGQHLVDGKCKNDPPPPPPHCDRGQHLVDGRCKNDTPPPPPHCDRGQHLVDGKCKK